jgi:lipopolysaccharide/colanic/teichoic acid biosynthesis glycosyltransferase
LLVAQTDVTLDDREAIVPDDFAGTLPERTAHVRRTLVLGRQRLLRWKFIAGFAVAVVLPWLVRNIVVPEASGASLDNAFIGTAVALIIGYYLLRSFSNFPGVRGGGYILPSFSASYGLVLAWFFFLRLDYSRFQFIASFAIACAWYYSDFFASRRRRRPTIGVVPVGQAMVLHEVDGVDWRDLDLHGDDAVGCESIVVDLRADMPDEWERFLADHAIAGVPVLHFKQVQESLTGRVQIEHLSENNFGSLSPEHIYLQFKQLVDVISAVIVGILLLPVLLPVALMVRLTSPGPALFKQKRIGFRGQPFTVYKFRTMRHDGDGGDRRETAITHDNDARITPLGAFLRRSRIDELPQIWNIVRGQMSWIGPRPEAYVLSQWYEEELPFYRYRHIVRPGITGWAQVNQGHVADVADVLWKLQYDFYYIKYFSPWLDLLIVLRTCRTMLTGFGAR